MLNRMGKLKFFAINLERNENKKEHIINECLRHGIDVEIIKAIDGSVLSDDYMKSVVFDYPNCSLTKGEIGCALSHNFVYKKIIDENINLALIIEDDAILCDNINNIINEIDTIDNINTDCVYLLNKVHAYVENKKLNSINYDFFRVYDADCTHGYVINNKAAKKLLSNNYPVIFEADMWNLFNMWFGLKIYCAFPHVIETNDEDKRSSDIEPERKLIERSRFSHRKKLKRK